MNEKKNGNGNGSTALAKLLNQLNLPTLVVILLTGGGNFLLTKEDGRLTRHEAERVSSEVHALYSALDDFEKRQKDTLDRQSAALRNQTEMLQNQQKILNELHRRQQTYRNPEP